VIARSGDNAAAARGRDDGRFRVSRGDREQVIELLKTAFVDERLTTEELDARVGQALTSRTRADLAAVTADIPAGPNVSRPPREAAQAHGQPSTRYVARHAAKASTAKPSTAKPSTARVGVAVVVAVKVMVVLSFVTSIPPLFLLLVLCCVTVVIATVARILSSLPPPEG
jgi:hypothetical protein